MERKSYGLRHKPRLALACTAAWLDPLRFMREDFEDTLYDGAEHSAAQMALLIARLHIPALYPRLVEQVRQSASVASVVEAFSAYIRQKYPFIPVEEFADRLDSAWGIPLVLYGFDPLEPEFVANFAEWRPVLEDLGLVPVELEERHWLYSERHPCAYQSDHWERVAEQIASPLIGSLIRIVHGGVGQPYANLAFLLLRMFRTTGSDLVDITDEDFWESGFEPPGWTPSELEYTNHGYAEAELILRSAQRGLETLLADKKLRACFRRNVKRLRVLLKKGEHPTHACLHWPGGDSGRCLENSASGRTADELAVLYLRNHYAPPRP